MEIDSENNTLQNDAGMSIHRPVYQIAELNKDTLYERSSTTLLRKIGNTFSSIHLVTCFLSAIPLIKWLPGYKWRKHFLSDVISGITVAIMHIPQGMAYGLLGGVPPVVGIYMAFFPVLVYFIFGTSRHVSIGTFAIVCLMTGRVVNQYSNAEILQNGTTILTSNYNQMSGDASSVPLHTNVQIATTVTFCCALIQFMMYAFRLGIVSTLLSETLVNGFTCASAFHVIASQLKDLFGVKVHKRLGNFAFAYTIYDAAVSLPTANLYACLISFISCTIIILNNEFFKSWLAKKTKMPFPIELVAVVLGTTVSYLMSLNEKYGISVVGHIPTGLPEPALPVFSLVPNILLESFVITMVSYTITMSMALIFARKLMYDVDSNQELLALGFSNTLGSFFSCMPVTASLSRSVVQQTVGGVTQIASLVSCSILLVILLWIGPCFETLPRCVLASVIVIALKSMVFQCTAIIRYWKLSKWDALVWLVTFSATLIFQISIGLAAGVAVSLLSIFIQGYRPYTCLLGVVPGTDLYLDVKRHKGVHEISAIKIFHYSGGLSFASRTSFKELLTKRICFDPAQLLRKRIKLDQSNHTNQSSSSNNYNNTNNSSSEYESSIFIKVLVLDFTALTFIDPAGVEMLRVLRNDLDKLDIALYIAGCSDPVYETILRCDQYEGVEARFMLFPTVHDAILYAQNFALAREKLQ